VVVLLGIAFLAGLITAVSPCVLPVLPIVLAGGASGGRRRPYAIVAGMIAMFVVSILFATYLLHELGLPQDLLRNVAIALLFAVAVTLLWPRAGLLLERALAPLSRRLGGGGDLGGGFLLGAALGFAFVPCGGPILAYVSAQAASVNFGFKPIALAIAYALGASVVMLGIAVGGRRVAGPLRARMSQLRIALGIVVGASALALVFNADTRLQTALPNWTNFLQRHTEQTAYASHKLYGRSATPKPVRQTSLVGLPDYGPAPALHPGGRWFNTAPLTLRQLRGKVVLIDFWTYSCINCLRTLPHLEAWYSTYHPEGFVIIGVHTPEFAFEHVASNVGAAIRRLGIKYPVVQDNNYETWTAYNNEYWPAEFLIDRTGHIRHVHLGESSYGETEGFIRRLLSVTDVKETKVPDLTPTGFGTPESYLGYERLERYAGSSLHKNAVASYTFPRAVPQNELAYAGSWNVMSQRIVAGLDARLRLHFLAQHVYLVLGGHGRVSQLLDGMKRGTIDVNSYRLYTLLNLPKPEDATLDLHFTPGVQAYAFTFG
jgi:cytochrome c biogenesis protein CcdA/thiol-disulfide isomerase/thioredoxin